MAVNVLGGALEFDAVIANTQFKRQFDEIERRLQGLTNTAKKEAAEMDKLVTNATRAIAAYATLSTATNFISDIVRTRGEFQKLEVAFTTMLASKEKADKLMAQAVQLAAVTPFTLQDVATGAKQLLAYGFGAETVTDNLRTLGNIASGVGAPLNDIVYLYGTLRSQGRAFAVDIRQFAQRGIPIYEELAKVLKVNVENVSEMVEQGKVGFPQVEEAFQNLTQSGGKFFNLMEEQSKTLTGLISNLQDAWQVMLNDIGRSNEGAFGDAIKAATSLVKNYETVLDILKVIIATYGAYRAAIIATTVAQNFATAAAKGYTVAETLRYQAMLISERAMKLLNLTMLSNPFVAVATGITALVAALLIFGKETTKVKNSAELMADAQQKTAESFNEQEAKVKSLVVQISQANTTEAERIRLYNQLKAINPSIVEGINQQAINYNKLQENVNKYLNALREQFRLEANEDAIKASIKQEQFIEQQIKNQQKLIDARKKLDEQNKGKVQTFQQGLVQGVAGQADQEKLKALNEDLEKQKKITVDLANEKGKLTQIVQDGNKVEEQTVTVLKQKLQKLQEERDNVSATSKKYKEYTKQIDEINKQIEKITGKQSSKDLKKELDEREKALQDFFENLNKAEDEARRAGLTKEDSELDKLNQRYDELLTKAKELGLGAGVQQRIENARKAQTGALSIKEQVDDYKKSIEQQQQIFEQFEEAKREFGVETAKQMFKEQLQGFDSFLDFLQAEGEKALLARNTLEGQLKQEVVGPAFTNEQNKQQKERIEREKQVLADALDRSKTFNSEKLRLDEAYEQQRLAIIDKYKGADKEERLKALKEQHDAEIDELSNAAKRSSDVFKKMNKDITFLTRDQLKAHLKQLKEILANDATLPPELEEALRNYIKQLDDLIKHTGKGGKIAENFGKAAVMIDGMASAFHELGDAVKSVNEGLGDTLGTVGDVLNIFGSLASATANFASGNIIGGIQGVVKAVSGIFQIGAKARESERQAKAEIEDFNTQILIGEQEVTAQYRERQREQVKLNKLRIEGLEQEQKLLDKQRNTVNEQYQLVLQQLQKENAIVGKTTEKYGGFLGIGRKTRAKDILESLAGKSFEDLEQLFLKGQLEGKAKELFQTLQKLKEEGADIDNIIAENTREAQQLFTGTTAENITDTITQGFADGKRSVLDFADDTEDIIRGAMLNALKFQALEGPIQKLFEQFAKDAEDQGGLDKQEIADFTASINKTISDATKFAEQIEQATGVNLSQAESAQKNSLTGAIKGIREDQADLLAGQFGGLRLTAVQQLNVATNQLSVLNAIKGDTGYLVSIDRRLRNLEDTGIKMKW